MTDGLTQAFKLVNGFSGIKFEKLFIPVLKCSNTAYSLVLQRNHARLEPWTSSHTKRIVPMWSVPQ